MTEPVKCRCGRKAIVADYGNSGLYQVVCWFARCWDGPARKTRAAAVSAWNKVMSK